MAMPDQAAPAATTPQTTPEIRIYGHSAIIFWWPVWAYGFFCAALTFFQGVPLMLPGSPKPILMHPDSWVGLSYTIVLLLVIVSTSVRARGVNALLLLMLIGGAAAATYFVMKMPGLWTTPPALLLNMNLAFYMLVSSVLFIVWFVIVFIVDRMSFLRVHGAQVERVQLFGAAMGRAPKSWSVLHMRLARYSDDLIAHKVLSLGFLGFGTSDIDAKLSIFGGGHEQFRIHNVWRAKRALEAVRAAMGQKATVVT